MSRWRSSSTAIHCEFAPTALTVAPGSNPTRRPQLHRQVDRLIKMMVFISPKHRVKNNAFFKLTIRIKINGPVLVTREPLAQFRSISPRHARGRDRLVQYGLPWGCARACVMTTQLRQKILRVIFGTYCWYLWKKLKHFFLGRRGHAHLFFVLFKSLLHVSLDVDGDRWEGWGW